MCWRNLSRAHLEGMTMLCASIRLVRIATAATVFAAGGLCATKALAAEDADVRGKSLAEQIFGVMVQDPGTKPGHRVAHAKGIVCEGTFVPSPRAATLSK